ncbi:LOW QUALITY PROTEIN: YTX2-like protein, partial [Mya arenaria]
MFKVVSINVNGLRNNLKRVAVFNWIKDNDYEFALLQETHCSTDFEAKIWSSQWNGNAFWNNGDSNSKGVAILVSYVCVEKISHMIKGRFQTININVDADKTFTISNVYASNNTVDKKIFFTEINRALKATQNEKHIIGGDFNCTQNVTLDRKTVSIDIKEDESLLSMNQIIFDNELEDIWRRRHPKTKMYTFNRNKSYSRIDYILTSKSIGNEVDSTIKHFPLSDHDAISIKLVMETETRGPGLWKMNTSILENPEYVKRFELFWKEWTKQKCNFSTLTSWWEIAKIRIKEISIDFCKELNKSKTSIKQLKNYGTQKQLTDDICSEIQLLSEKIKDHYKNQAKAAQIRSRAKFITENEKSTAYFFNLEKIRGKEKLWSKIKTESGETKYELEHSVFNFKKSKSPGIDGIPAEWYQKFWYIIKHDFVELTTEILSTNKLCDT